MPFRDGVVATGRGAPVPLGSVCAVCGARRSRATMLAVKFPARPSDE
jgi:hypothetical protein